MKYRLIRTIVGVAFAFIVNFFLGKMSLFIMPLSTFIVLQVGFGETLLKILQRCLLIFVILFLLCLATAILNHNSVLFFDSMNDVVIGIAIGIFSHLLIFPHRADVVFREKIIPILESFSDDLLKISQAFLQDKKSDFDSAMMSMLKVEQAHFPEWVYAKNFNPALKAGHQHFLMMVDQVSQILITMHYAVSHSVPTDLMEQMRAPIESCFEQARAIIAAIVATLKLQKPENLVSDFLEDVEALEKSFYKEVTLPLELLDMSEEYIALAEFIYTLKDLQRALFKLGTALRS